MHLIAREVDQEKGNLLEIQITSYYPCSIKKVFYN